MKSAPHLLIFDGFADWEAAYAVAELRRSGKQQVVTVGYTGEPVVSMGGLCVLPDYELAELDVEMIRLLILPGGEAWEREPADPALESLLRHLLAHRVPVAAICAATVALARIGALDDRQHTGNGLAWLQQQVPSYAGAGTYVEAPAVRDRGVITARGTAALEFAREIFAELGIFSAEERAEWFRLFKEGGM